MAIVGQTLHNGDECTYIERWESMLYIQTYIYIFIHRTLPIHWKSKLFPIIFHPFTYKPWNQSCRSNPSGIIHHDTICTSMSPSIITHFFGHYNNTFNPWNLWAHTSSCHGCKDLQRRKHTSSIIRPFIHISTLLLGLPDGCLSPHIACPSPIGLVFFSPY